MSSRLCFHNGSPASRPSTALGICREKNVISSPSSSAAHSSPSPSPNARAREASVARFRSEFPNLPGFGRHSPARPDTAPKNQSLNFVNGFMMVNAPLPDLMGARCGGGGGFAPASAASAAVGSVVRTVPPPSSPGTWPRSPSGGRPVTASAIMQSREVFSPNDVTGRYSFARKKRADRTREGGGSPGGNDDGSGGSDGAGGGGGGGGFALPFCPSSRLPAFLEHDRRVLLFNAYYEEDVLQSAVETRRVHICDIYFYVEDGTIEIIHTKQENSGIPQGVFLRRSRVEKPESQRRRRSSAVRAGAGHHTAPPDFYTMNDLKIGNDVEIYGRRFSVVDCNESTRKYVTDALGWHEVDVAPLPFPRDSFTEYNRTKMRRESGVPGVDRKRKMNELKEVMESMLGKQISVTDRGSFLESGQDALCFHIVWDDRERLFGDVQFFKLFYFLADDTVEILPMHRKTDGWDHMPKLLRRLHLPKDGMLESEAVRNEENNKNNKGEGCGGSASASGRGDNGGLKREFYSWEDFGIGNSINIFGRRMHMARCDKFTRDYYLSKGVTLNANMDLEPPEERVHIERIVPPYNGFGSEEDSLRSCTAPLNPPPPKKDLAKMREKQGVILRFNAHLLSDKTEDETRRFVIQYFMEDDTIGIREPPIHNSGVMGGSFLRRQVLKRPDGIKYDPGDMYVGNVVDFLSHKFVLLNADEYSYRAMEGDERTFPYSDFGRLHDLLAQKMEEIRQYFVARYSHEGGGMIDMADFGACLGDVGLKLNKQETLTLWRKLDRRNKGKISFTKIVKLASVGPFGGRL